MCWVKEMTEPLNGKYECYGQNLWWDKLAKQRLSTDASEVLEDVKLACEFYLKYFDKPHKLKEDYPEIADEVDEIINETIEMTPEEDGWSYYNKWLFKLAFKDVLGGGD